MHGKSGVLGNALILETEGTSLHGEEMDAAAYQQA
jgi:hypothetical protein